LVLVICLGSMTFELAHLRKKLLNLLASYLTILITNKQIQFKENFYFAPHGYTCGVCTNVSEVYIPVIQNTTKSSW